MGLAGWEERSEEVLYAADSVVKVGQTEIWMLKERVWRNSRRRIR